MKTFAIQGKQGKQGKYRCYTAVLTLRQLVDLLSPPDRAIAPERRAQRALQESRAHIIADYVGQNSDYVLPPLTLSVSKLSFDKGLLTIPEDAVIFCNDGQHRRRAIEIALGEHADRLALDTVTVVVYEDADLASMQQRFADLNSAQPAARSVKLLYDLRNASKGRTAALATPFAGLVEMEAANAAPSSDDSMYAHRLRKETKMATKWRAAGSKAVACRALHNVVLPEGWSFTETGGLRGPDGIVDDVPSGAIIVFGGSRCWQINDVPPDALVHCERGINVINCAPPSAIMARSVDTPIGVKHEHVGRAGGDRCVEKEILRRPDWLEALDDVCLRRTLSKALVERDQAIEFGALRNHRAKNKIASGDRTVEQIASGRYVGEAARKRAADALCKYTHAFDLAAVRPPKKIGGK